jgi:hypothetical protein
MSQRANVKFMISSVCVWLSAVLFSYAMGRQIERGGEDIWAWVTATGLLTLSGIFHTIRAHRRPPE